MSKKNYIAIAEILRHYVDNRQISSMCEVFEELTDYFEQDNPKFDHVRFLEACGISQDDK